MAAKTRCPHQMKERDCYERVKSKLEELLKDKAGNAYLEQTADKSFSNSLKSVISQGHEIIFNFLKGREARPDITGYLKTKYNRNDFVVAEIKLNDLKLDDIYQMRKYADLFNARFAFLISLQPVPEEIKRLASTIRQVLYSADLHQTLLLVRFDYKKNEFAEWYPKNPFEEEFRWQDYQIA